MTFDPEQYMAAIHAMENGAKPVILDPEEESVIYHVDIASEPVEMSFRLSLLEWHMLIGMLSGCSDHTHVGDRFTGQFQENMVQWARKEGREVERPES